MQNFLGNVGGLLNRLTGGANQLNALINKKSLALNS
jgi:hypothetical protein